MGWVFLTLPAGDVGIFGINGQTGPHSEKLRLGLRSKGPEALWEGRGKKEKKDLNPIPHPHWRTEAPQNQSK